MANKVMLDCYCKTGKLRVCLDKIKEINFMGGDLEEIHSYSEYGWKIKIKGTDDYVSELNTWFSKNYEIQSHL